VLGRTAIEVDGRTIDLAPPWRRVSLREAIREATGIDIREHGESETLIAAMRRSGIDQESPVGKPTGGAPRVSGWGKLVDGLLSKHVEPQLLEPTFVFDYPTELSPFARPHRSEEDLVERFEGFVGGIEIANAFSELSDPDEQRRRLEQQRLLREAGDEEAQPYDEDYVQALEYGMPPTGGLGLGIDRLVMLLSGRKSLREVILFPALRNR
jgi:lysyl-tRNA synthetase, class II